jgi:hypothetical protein
VQHTDADCNRKPNNSEIQQAATNRIKGFQRLSVAGDDYKTDLLAMKQYLAQGSPIIIGNMVGGSFMQDMLGKDTWLPTREDYNENGFGGHCMCVIGYDDFKFGNEGGFQIMNSWGSEWGNNGIAWVRYKDFEFFNKEAYAIYPMGSGQKFDDQKLAAEIGLIDNATKANINLIRSGSIFKTANAIPKGTKFKIEVSNRIECYVYVFGQDTDASSYTLFPYTKKHSPYCGITGMRLFPRDYSLTADDYGNTDYMAIVITKAPIDFNKLNEAINASDETGYASKINDALKAELISDINYMPGNRVSFQCDKGNKNAVAIIVQVDKK